jgi:pimeloyl-ACP methyl ester carboxylesterase
VAGFSFADVHRVALYAALATGCASWLPAPAPMRTIANRASATGQARCLLVLMPGIGDSAEDFADHGFIDAVRQRQLPVDIISTNATLGYYAKRTLHDRIEADVLAPARKAGYEQIWFGGISMGGLGSLLIAERHAAELAGIILLAPYLGEDEVIDEVAKAGGLARWQPPATSSADDYQRGVWRWLKRATEKPASAPPIYLLSGDQDKFAQPHRLLGATLPPERRFRTRGKHDWGPWKLLWTDFLDRSDFRSRCEDLRDR